jgi:hypothetical protein
MNEQQIKALFGQLGELLERVTRLETRMVRLMNFVGCDTQGKPVDRKDQQR